MLSSPRVLLLVAAIFLLCQPTLLRGYKIKRTNCSRVEDKTIYCSCGGIGDPFAIILNKGPKPEMGLPYYGTRYGHNLALQVKQALLDRNLTHDRSNFVLKRIVYSDCTDHPLRVKLDFSEFDLDKTFKVDLRQVREIEFNNVHSVNLYLTKSITWGKLHVAFNNINGTHDFGGGHEAALVIRGKVTFCKNPCKNKRKKLSVDDSQSRDDRLDETTPDIFVSDDAQPSTEKNAGMAKVGANTGDKGKNDSCDKCNSDSELLLTLNKVTEVLLSDYEVLNERFGFTRIEMDDIDLFRVEGGAYDGLEGEILAEACQSYDVATNCSEVLELGSIEKVTSGIAGIVVGAMAIILVFIVILAILFMFKLKPAQA